MIRNVKVGVLATAIILAVSANAGAKTTFVDIKVSPKSFISSCQAGGGSASGGQGSIACTSGNGNTVTSCTVKDGNTEDCIQVSRGKDPKSNTAGNGDQNAGNGNVGDDGSQDGRPDSASAGNDGAAGSMGGNTGGNAIN